MVKAKTNFLGRLNRALYEAGLISKNMLQETSDPPIDPDPLGLSMIKNLGEPFNDKPSVKSSRPESDQSCEYCGATSKVSAVPGDDGFSYVCAQCFTNLRLGAKYPRVEQGKPGELPQLRLRRRRKFDPDHTNIEYGG